MVFAVVRDSNVRRVLDAREGEAFWGSLSGWCVTDLVGISAVGRDSRELSREGWMDVQFAESCIYLLIGGIVGYAEQSIEVSFALHVPVCFDEGVDEVGEDDADVDATTVGVEGLGAGLWFWRAGADGDVVVEGL